jgi:hypothetical protein
MALAIAKEKKQMPLPGTMGALVHGGAHVMNFIEEYQSITCRTGTNPVDEDMISTIPCYCAEMIQEPIKIMNRYLRKDWVQLQEELKDRFRHTNTRVYMNTRSYLVQLRRDQLDCGNFGLKAFILAYNNISSIMINKGVLAKFSQVQMFLGALPHNLKGKAVMKFKRDPRGHWTFKYDTLRKHVLDKCATGNALPLLDSEGARTVPGVSPYSIPAGVSLPQMRIVMNIPSIPNEVTPARAHATEEIPVAIGENTIDMKIDNMMKTFEALTFQLSKANEPRYGCYQTARAYAIQANHPPPHIPMNFSPPNAPTYPLTPDRDPITSSTHGND